MVWYGKSKILLKYNDVICDILRVVICYVRNDMSVQHSMASAIIQVKVMEMQYRG